MQSEKKFITVLVTAGLLFLLQLAATPETALASDDMIIDFGSAGTWVLYDGTDWSKLHPGTPDSITTGDLDGNGRAELILDFGTSGIWIRTNNTSWSKLHNLNPQIIATGDIDGNARDDVIIDFGPGIGIWLYVNNSSWKKLHSSRAEIIVSGDIDGDGSDDVIIDFGTSGIWVWKNNASWERLHQLSAEIIAVGDLDGGGKDDIILDFGTSTGIWVRKNDTTWERVHKLAAEIIRAGDIDGNWKDDIILDFGFGKGIWAMMNGTRWEKIHSLTPELIEVGDIDGNGKDDVMFDFGSAHGLWVRYDNTKWEKQHMLSPGIMATCDMDGSSEPGSLSYDQDTGVSTYEGKEKEFVPGVTSKESIALIPGNSENEQVGHKVRGMLKFVNTTDAPKDISFYKDISKNIAQHVNNLEFKIVTGDASSDIGDFINDTQNFIPISDLVNSGLAEIINEDPSIMFTIALGVLAIGGAAEYVLWGDDLSNYVSVRPKESAANVEQILHSGGLDAWMDNHLGEYCDKVRASADTNNVPPRLLAAVILNEIADNDWRNQLQELVNTGPGRSHGWAQLQANRVKEHGLIDIGPKDRIRDINVDIDENDLTMEIIGDPGVPYMTVDRRNDLIWERLVNPESAIEIAAREISYLLNLLNEESPYRRNPWARALLKDPEQGIDRNDLYENLKINPDADVANDPIKRQIELEKTLALLIVAGYNGQGAIFKATDENEIFVIEKDPWGAEPEGSFGAPRRHANNAMVIFPETLYSSWCFKEQTPVECPEDPQFIGMTLSLYLRANFREYSSSYDRRTYGLVPNNGTGYTSASVTGNTFSGSYSYSGPTGDPTTTGTVEGTLSNCSRMIDTITWNQTTNWSTGSIERYSYQGSNIPRYGAYPVSYEYWAGGEPCSFISSFDYSFNSDGYNNVLLDYTCEPDTYVSVDFLTYVPPWAN